MRYVVQKNLDTNVRYATHLRPDGSGEKLKWDSSPGKDILVVQTAYGTNALEDIYAICMAMDNASLPTDRFIEVMSDPDIWVRYVTSTDYLRDDGCSMHGKACAYTIFCCEIHGDECIVYEQDDGRAGNYPYRNVRLDIPIRVHKMTQVVGLFRQREVETGYWQIILPSALVAYIHDGDVAYTVADAKELEIPLTQQMFNSGTVYIKSYNQPKFISRNKGLQVLQQNR